MMVAVYLLLQSLVLSLKGFVGEICEILFKMLMSDFASAVYI